MNSKNRVQVVLFVTVEEDQRLRELAAREGYISRSALILHHVRRNLLKRKA